MPKATKCLLGDLELDIKEAIEIRDAADARGGDYPVFECRECGELVRPHKTGTTNQQAHFEHRIKNARCSLGS